MNKETFEKIFEVIDTGIRVAKKKKSLIGGEENENQERYNRNFERK